ncbi:hypothetical protein [Ligilactobacillus sp.]|uniref:hypothetical protein n=1 Tax=Ligilactobacillus sp. TaxID=2767921 RepID=UPI002FE343E6
MAPEQELYDYFYTKCLEIRPDATYDYLPGEDEKVDYPIICVGNVQMVSTATKLRVGGTYTINIDVWGSKKQRLEVADIAEKIYSLIKPGIISTDNYRFYASFNTQQKQMLLDTSVPNTIYHRGALTLEFRQI